MIAIPLFDKPEVFNRCWADGLAHRLPTSLISFGGGQESASASPLLDGSRLLLALLPRSFDLPRARTRDNAVACVYASS
jgi:hypothetical protein